MYLIIDVNKYRLQSQSNSLEEITALAQDKCIKERASKYIVKVIARVDAEIYTTMTTYNNEGREVQDVR